MKKRRASRAQNLIRRIEKDIAAAVGEVYGESCGYGRAGAVDVPLELRLAVRCGEDRQVSADPPLAEQVRAAVRAATARDQVYQPGRVFCYRCESSLCPHGIPPAPSRVFGGYSPTGLPQWPELAQVLIAIRHPRVDGLYDQASPVLAAASVEAETLKLNQLGVFGRRSKTYDILAQAVFGFLTFQVRGRGGRREREKAAVTLQAVEVQGRPRRRILLNVIGRLSDGTEVVQALEGAFHMRIHDSLVAARRQIGRIVPGSKGARSSRSGEEARRILQRTAKALERLGRQSERRTGHAEMRRTEKRPTAKALEDARAVQDEKLFWDERRQTVVVLGSRTRVHIFSPGGRHITSLNLRREEVEGRRKRERWRVLDPSRRGVFREALEKASTSASDHAADGVGGGGRR